MRFRPGFIAPPDYSQANLEVARYPPFTSRSGVWVWRILSELDEQLGSSRIIGPLHLRAVNGSPDVPATEKPKKAKKPKRKRAITGGTQPNPPNNTGVNKSVNPPPVTGVQSERSYPLGKRLRYADFEASRAHGPKGKVSEKPQCWNFNENCGRSFRGKECEHCLRKLMKKTGLRWAMDSQMARLGGIKGTDLLSASEIDGYVTALREANIAEAKNGSTSHRWILSGK